jgi:hypothetical protein
MAVAARHVVLQEYAFSSGVKRAAKAAGFDPEIWLYGRNDAFYSIPFSQANFSAFEDGIRCMRSILSVEIIILATPATIEPIRRRDFQNVDAGLLHEAQESGAVAAGGFDTDALDIAEGSHPGKHLPIPLASCRKASGSDNTILLVNHSRDMQILVGVHAAHDASFCAFFTTSHSGSPG